MQYSIWSDNTRPSRKIGSPLHGLGKGGTYGVYYETNTPYMAMFRVSCSPRDSGLEDQMTTWLTCECG